MDCIPQGYLDSSELMKPLSHVISLAEIPFNVYGILLIYYKTPFRMRNMKFSMLIAHVLSTISDIMLGTMTIPFVFFPAISGTPLGTLSDIGVNAFVQTFVTVGCVAEVGSSIALMFENRHNQSVTSNFRIQTKFTRCIFTIVNLLTPFFFMIAIFLQIPEQVTARDNVVRENPCLTREFFNFSIIVITDQARLVGFFFVLLSIFYMCQIVFFILHSSWYLCRPGKSNHLSERTKKMQRKYFFAVCVQISIPLVIIITPVYYFIFSIVTGYYNQKLNNLCFIVMSLHGFFATIVTILLYEHYRIFTVNLILCRKQPMLTPSTKSTADITIVH